MFHLPRCSNYVPLLFFDAYIQMPTNSKPQENAWRESFHHGECLQNDLAELHARAPDFGA